ncbi:MAG: glycosyltransferase family 39 protein [Chthonomonas sp.]|nr:glycosyltransferase family 39 protein [Chthonomonas sp.]
MSQALKFGILLFLAALAIRLVGIDWGLPGPLRITSLHPDEPINWMVTRQAADLTPNFYNYGTLFFTIQNLALGLLHLLGLGVSADGSGTTAGLAQEFLTGRLMSALAGAGVVWVVWSFLFKRVHWVGALAGALAAMLSPGMVVHSRFMTVDVMATLFIALSLYWACEALESETMRPFILAGLFAGLAAGAKYNGILALAAVLPAVWLSKERLKVGAAALGTAVVTFVACVPGVFLESEAFMRDFKYEMWHTGAGHGLVFAGTSPGFFYHWSNLFVAMGLLLTCMGLVGLGRLAYRRVPWVFGLLLFFVLYFLLIGKAEVKFMRYVFPLIPVLAIGFGWLVGRMQAHPDRRKWSWGVALAMCAIAGMGRGGLADTTTATFCMLGTDPRDLAALIVKKDASVGLVADPWFYTASLYPETVAPRPIPFAERERARLAQTAPRVLRYIPTNPDERVDWDVRLIDELKPDSIVFSSFEQEGYERMPDGSPEKQRYTEFWIALNRDYAYLDLSLLGSGLPEVHDLMYIRPKVQIWKRKSTSSSTP